MQTETLFSSTIAAVSTPRGKGGVALIRISGEEAAAVAGRCFFPKCGKSVGELEARRAYFGDIVSGGKVIDDGLCTLFRAPHSYTGEDMVEISCHGGMLVTQRVLEAVFAAGAVSAAAGEFTRRAFVGGKLSLTKAEAIAEILDARSDTQLEIAAAQRRGALSEKLEEAEKELIALCGAVYARIDYPDEDLGEISDDEFADRAAAVLRRLEALASTYRAGSAIFEGINTVICGAPNRGKSSLYNALAGEDAAIVTPIAGTTRDTLERDLPLGRVMLHLVDTAGIHGAADEVEKIGVARAETRVRGAELVFCLFDASQPFSDEDAALCELLSGIGAPKLALLNKLDVKCGVFTIPARYRALFCAVIEISAKSGEGLDRLRETVEDLFSVGAIETSNGAVVTNARQFAALTEARTCVGDAIHAVRSGMGADVASSDLERAIATLGELDGRRVSEAIVSEIFSHFCVGK